MYNFENGVRAMAGLTRVYEQMASIAAQEGAARLVLFGSRARGTEMPKSDIDLAVEGCPGSGALYDRLQEEPGSPLEVDSVNLDDDVSDALRREIERDGKVLYEKG